MYGALVDLDDNLLLVQTLRVDLDKVWVSVYGVLVDLDKVSVSVYGALVDSEDRLALGADTAGRI